MDGVRIGWVKFKVVIAMVLALLALHAVADSKDDFLSHYVADFSRPSEHRRVTSVRQNEMLLRRRGTYVADLGELSGRVGSQLGKDVRRFIVDITDNGRVRLVFECAAGGYVSSRAFLAGQMSDLSFRWESPAQTVVAWYGVQGDCLPIVFFPRTQPAIFVMKRREGTLDLRKISIVASMTLSSEGKMRADDVFGLVCETGESARRCRLRAKLERCPGECPTARDDEIVACYCTEKLPTRVSLYGRPRSTSALLHCRYWVLQADGRISLVDGDGKDRFKLRPNFEFPWWEEFNGMPYGEYSTLYDVRRDEIAVIQCPFALSMEVDRRIVSPRLFERKEAELGQKTLGQRLEEVLAWQSKEPDRIFPVQVYRRIKNTAENRKLRGKLKNATKLEKGVVYD